MCIIVLSSSALDKEQPKIDEVVCKTTHCRSHLEQIVVCQGTPRPLLNSQTPPDVFITQSHYHQKEFGQLRCQACSRNMRTHRIELTTTRPLYPQHHPFSNVAHTNHRTGPEHCLCDSTVSLSLVLDRVCTVCVLSQSSPKGREAKGGSKSSTSSSSSHRSGGSGNRQGNTGGRPGDRTGGSRRGFSSGSSDSSEDDKDDDDKRRPPYRHKNKEPKSKPGFSDDEDDEATDSADEGGNQAMTLDYSPQSQKEGTGEGRGSHPRGGSKDSFRPIDLPTGLSKPRGSNGSSSSTISVESIMGLSEVNQMDTGETHVPPSPVNMSVGYGTLATPLSSAAPLDSVLESNQLTEKSPTESTKGLDTPIMDSPRPLVLKEPNSPGTPPAMSPEIPPTFPAESSSSAKVTGVPLQGPITQPAASSLPGGGSFGTLPFETTWGWQPPVYSPFALPGSSHPGSVATTPAPTSDNSGGFLRPGTTALLQATVCQESEGVLIVTVRWRNRNFSGSLIDIGHHDWAPPKLSCPYGDVQIKDLYKQKEVENQSITVDVLEDSKEIGAQPKSELTETEPSKKASSQLEKPLIKEEAVLPVPVPMEMESITVMASSDPSEVGQANLRTLLTKPEVESKSPYSDISSGSDTEIVDSKSKKPTRELKQASSESRTATPPTTVTATVNGFYPYKILDSKPNKGKESLTNMSARLPSFGEVGQRKASNKHHTKGDEFIPDSQPSSPKERSSGKQTNSAVEVRTKLMHQYPSSSASDTSVSMPEQDQRHSRVASLYASPNAKQPPQSKGHENSAHSHSALHTLSDVASSMMPVHNKEKPSTMKQPRMTMLTQEDFKQDPGGRVRRSVSPRPGSLLPKAPPNRRSPSPARLSRQALEQQAATLPPFDPLPGGAQRGSEGSRGSSPPVFTKPGSTCEWGLEASRNEDGHDSDSSGSGSLLPTVNKPQKHSKRHSKSGLGNIKTDKSSREEGGNAIQPQTPALAPIPSDKFSLKNIQPISPGPDGPHPPTGHPIHPQKMAPISNTKKEGLPPDTHLAPHHHVEPKKQPPPNTRDSIPQGIAIQVPTVGDVLKNMSVTSSNNGPSAGQVSGSHTVISMQGSEGGMPIPFTKAESMVTNHEQDKDHHRLPVRHPEDRRHDLQVPPSFPSTYHQRPRSNEAVIHISDERGSPNKEDEKPELVSKGSRKRAGVEIPYTMAKRHERDEHSIRGMKIPKQYPPHEVFITTSEGEEIEVPAKFKSAMYDPNMPMSLEYQYIAYMNQKKAQDEQQQQQQQQAEIGKMKQMSQMVHHSLQQHLDGKGLHSHPRRQKSNEHVNPHNSVSISHEGGKLPRQSSGEGSHRSSLTNIASSSGGVVPSHGKSHQNGSSSSVIQTIKSEPEEFRYQPGGKMVTPVVCVASQQIGSTGGGRRPNTSVKRPAARREESTWAGYRQTPPSSQAHAIASVSGIHGYPPLWNVSMTQPADVKPKAEVSVESSRNGESKKGLPLADWQQRPGSSFSPVITGRPPTSSPSTHSHSHHHHSERVTAGRGGESRGERERDGSKYPRHNITSHLNHEQRGGGESEREGSAHIHTSQHPRQNSSSSTSSNHSTHPSTSGGGSSRNPTTTKDQAATNQAAAVQLMQQQQQMLHMQQLAALQQLHQQQQQQLSPNALATLQRTVAGGGIPISEEYLKHIQQQQQQQYEMLQKANTIQTPTALNPQELLQLQMQMQMAAAQMGVGMADPNAATMAFLVQQQQAAQAQQQAVQQQQQQQVQEAQAQAAVAAQQAAIIQAAAAQNSVLPLVYPIATPSGQISFYDPSAFAGAGMQVPFAIPSAPKRE